MKKLLALLLAMTLVISTFTGCQSKPVEPISDGDAATGDEKVVVWNMGVDQNSWDPPYTYTMLAMNINENIYEGLLESTEEGIKPAQAESYVVSEDQLTYTFTLRKGLKWSDGKDLTAHDYEYSWKRVCDPALASEYSYILYPYVVGGTEFMNGTGTIDDIAIKALDDLTLEVKLTAPVPYFPQLAAFAVYKPVRKDIIEKYGEGWDKSPLSCITNGPYKMTDYQMGSHMMIEKNEHYWDVANVKVPKIKIIFLGEDTTALNAYEAGEIQVLMSVPTDEIARLKIEDPNFRVGYKASTAHLIFSIDKDPVNDINIRKALTLAIDRVKLTEQVLKGGQVPATGIIPPQFTYSDGTSCRTLDAEGKPAAEFYIDPFDSAKNIAAAKEYLTKAGYPNGEGFPEISYTTSNKEKNKKVGEALVEMWKTNLNINVKLDIIDPATSGDMAKRGRYIISMGGFGADYIDPVAMLDCFMSTSVNNNCLWRWQPLDIIPEDTIMNPENKAYDEAINKSMSASGAERDALLREAERILIEEAVVGPIYYDVTTEIIDESFVKGVEHTQNGAIVFKNAELAD